jgi:methylaspartate mutase sigma subunit
VNTVQSTDVVRPSDALLPNRTVLPGRSSAGGLSILVTTVASDSHTWNLVFLQLALEEFGHRVRNLGPCVPPEDVVAEALRSRPDLVVVSTVNGHGLRDGTLLIGQLRSCPELADLPVVIGGKLGIAGPSGRYAMARLRAAGYDAVFEDGAGAAALSSLSQLVRAGQPR